MRRARTVHNHSVGTSRPASDPTLITAIIALVTQRSSWRCARRPRSWATVQWLKETLWVGGESQRQVSLGPSDSRHYTLIHMHSFTRLERANFTSTLFPHAFPSMSGNNESFLCGLECRASRGRQGLLGRQGKCKHMKAQLGRGRMFGGIYNHGHHIITHLIYPPGTGGTRRSRNFSYHVLIFFKRLYPALRATLSHSHFLSAFRIHDVFFI
jgi:hypothetical protein